MRGRIRRVILWTGLLALFSGTALAEERWVYRYNGPEDGDDHANSIVAGWDGNLYAAGYSYLRGTGEDFTVVSLSSSGVERWVYRYNGPGNGDDHANSIVTGSDGNLYAAGYSYGSGTGYDLTVVSLEASGVERWVHGYNGAVDATDVANSVVAGSDGNLYAAGYSYGDFTLVSLDPSGVERWVYRYNAPGNVAGLANSIDFGLDNNLYAAGSTQASGGLHDFTVLSLTDSGVERWVYRESGPWGGADWANSVVMGSDGNVYGAGLSWVGSTSGWDFTVVSLSDSGVERWVYRYNGFGSRWDEANSIVMGPDGNLYAAGRSGSSGTGEDFTVVSLSTSGSERWVYRYNGSGNGDDYANSIVAGSDGNLYAAGYSYGSGTGRDFTPWVLSAGSTDTMGLQVERMCPTQSLWDWTASSTPQDGVMESVLRTSRW
jgi:hypothetical protein